MKPRAKAPVAIAPPTHPVIEPDAYSIDEFCMRHCMSRSLYFSMQRAGQGPRVMLAGTKVLISKEAAAEWRRQCEQTAHTA